MSSRVSLSYDNMSVRRYIIIRLAVISKVGTYVKEQMMVPNSNNRMISLCRIRDHNIQSQFENI